jgi:hypothetical protein
MSLASESSNYTQDTVPTPLTLSALQNQPPSERISKFDPVLSHNSKSYDLNIPSKGQQEMYPLEKRAEELFSKEHLQVILSHPEFLSSFRNFLEQHRPPSFKVLTYYFDALKALRAIAYSNAVAEALDPIDKHEFTNTFPEPTVNKSLEEKAKQAFEFLVNEDLPAYVTYKYVDIVSKTIRSKITNSVPSGARYNSEGLAEVFCLTDPHRQDNPIVVSSEGMKP